MPVLMSEHGNDQPVFKIDLRRLSIRAFAESATPMIGNTFQIYRVRYLC